MAVPEPDEHDAAYWYDLPGADTRPPVPRVPERIRGPFEPLVSSADPPGAGDAAQARAEKLEQIKDLYLTAETLGEENVDKHFDQLLARQRELISEYFKSSRTAESSAGHPAEAEGEAEGGAAVPANAPGRPAGGAQPSARYP
ncbi:MAG: hypothetical protein JO037_14960 [Actinobacteria bacterium]|nr:hypothetical protein [Actinomycetota bacterium]